MDFPGGPVAKTLRPHSRRPKFDLWSGNEISLATTKDPACQNQVQRSWVPQLKPSVARQINNFKQYTTAVVYPPPKKPSVVKKNKQSN